jgi:phage tail sheath protein FI
VWTTPAGKIRGRILGVVSLQQNFSTADSDYLYAGKVNPVKTFPGEGTFLMGNKTSYSGTGVLGSINVVAMLAYLKKELLNIANSFLFEVNTPELRQEFISGAIPILESIKSGNGIYSYTIVSDSSNNTSTTIAANKLIVDVILKPTATAETIVITVINSDTSEILQG